MSHSATIAKDRILVKFDVVTRMGPLVKAGSPEARAWELIGSFKQMQLGGRYNPQNQTWSVPLEYANTIIAWNEKQRAGLEMAPELVELGRAEREHAAKLREASRATDAEIDLAVPKNLQLYGYQRAGVAYALAAGGRLFIADEMGLGKTVQALLTLEKSDRWPAVVVVPALLRENWRREIKKWLPHRMTMIARGRKVAAGVFSYAMMADIIIIGYDIVKDWLPHLHGMEAAIFDECHYIKNLKSQRTRACRDLADTLRPTAPLLMLSGTPLLNRPVELMAQLRVLGKLEQFGGELKFKARYCQGGKGASHSEELNERLRASCYVRRLKVDVLPDLPPKIWAEPIVVQDLHLADYNNVQSRVVRELAEQAKDKLEIADYAHQLARIEYLRQFAVQAKLPATVEWIDEFRETGQKLVVMAHHQSVVNCIADHYRTPRIVGGMSDRARQQAIDSFQQNDACQLVVCSLSAAGVGINLTAASNVLFVELPWTPAQLDQAADRCHRIGQTDSVTAWTILADKTIDMQIWDLLQKKRRVVDAVTEGDRDSDYRSMLADLVVMLTAG